MISGSLWIMIKKKNPLKDKSFAFAVRIVGAYKFLIEKREYVLSKQLLRSGTAIGALYREAQYAESKADFAHKLGIAQKETNETLYWLELLEETNFFSKKEFQSLFDECEELLKIITSSIKTAKH